MRTPAGAYRVALATARSVPELTDDDRRLGAALEELGVEVENPIWDDPHIAWERFDLVVPRSIWDYHRKFGRFEQWVNDLALTDVPLCNLANIISWNANKLYLRDLAAANIPTVPTFWLDPSDRRPLEDIRAACGWADIVVKPAISATAFGTFRFPSAVAANDEVHFDRLRPSTTFMIQPYVREIADGELSLIYIGGRFSHAVLKRPKAGDFRVQQDFGGTVTGADPSHAIVEFGAAVMRHVPGEASYARVDCIIRADRPMLMELELIEPALFLDFCTPSASDLAAEIVRKIEMRLGGGEPFVGLG